MSARKLAIDPLWQCLCPIWTSSSTHHAYRTLTQTRRPTLQCSNLPTAARTISRANKFRRLPSEVRKERQTQAVLNPLYNGPLPEKPQRRERERPSFRKSGPPPIEVIDYHEESTPALYNHMRGAAIDGKYTLCRFISEMLVKERGEKPNIQLYNTLILSNISHADGAAWRVSELLGEMEQDGLQADVGTCHAVLKVLSVHVDHLLRSDVLDYMSRRWLQLTEDGAHDVAAGLLREGLFEQALLRLDTMRKEGMHLRPWLLDMAVYVLCEANEIGEAHRVMRWRVDADELNLSRSLWMFFLDKAAEMRHHTATSLAWTTQVNSEYINPPSGICLNVLSTAAQAADAVLATEVVEKLSKRGTGYQPIHYELLINTYLSTDPPDLKRALSILTIMALEKVAPSFSETRTLYQYLRTNPELVSAAHDILRDLHDQGRKIPIAALNLLIECHVAQSNLPEALNLYKQIHTFVPIAEGAKKTFANIDTFNLLLKGCHSASPPEAHQASFLVSELLALRITPTSLTFDRLIITFVRAAQHAFQEAAAAEAQPPLNPNKTPAEIRATLEAKGKEFLDWAFRHFQDMQPLGWLPRMGTLSMLSLALAKGGDVRCWDVVQAGEDNAAEVDGWRAKGKQVRLEVQEALTKFAGSEGAGAGDGIFWFGGEEGAGRGGVEEGGGKAAAAYQPLV